ncbi:MAG: hypothetical protein K9K66_05225 [Desulfarculaceae bacterium]|nr:hypothetical protein [Desulfarculaceae bacterium]MCF8072875.1 hypothetical protein [Desulfarculaceae bacterium]MCF8101043.1 hypothetical protein [Desulfarculaceae bacterium]MCF8115570.1 hypothetical protein [Desulfarculaceae bacterium]
MWQAVCRRRSRRRPHPRGELVEGPWLARQEEAKVRAILNHYEQANARERLELYLQHRDLRPLFSQVEELMRN